MKIYKKLLVLFILIILSSGLVRAACVNVVDDLHINSDTILCPGSYTIIDSAGDGIIFIDASNIILDCNNAVISPSGPGMGIIVSNQNNNVIKNCDLNNFYRAISLEYSYNNKIVNSEFSSNSDGVYIYYSDYNIVEDNDFNSNSRGIYIEKYSDHNEIKNNTMAGNTFGVFTSSLSADYNYILYNSITGSTNYGAYIASDNNDISENYFDNANSDLYLHTSAEYNRVTGNDFYGAGVTGEGVNTDFCSGNRNYYDVGAARPLGEDLCGQNSISLTQGWNLISIPINLTNKALPDALQSIEGNYSKVVAYNSSDSGNEWKIYDPNDLPHSNLESIDEKMGIWIKMLMSDTLLIDGSELSFVNFNLKQGYNLISYPSLNENNVSYVFGGVNGDLVNVLTYENNEWKNYNPLKEEGLNTLKKLKPGYGYWVEVNKDVSWKFNGSSMISLEALPVNISIISPENKTYYTNLRKVTLAVKTNKEADCNYSLNNAHNITLYNDATEGSTIITGVFGQNNVVVYCSDGETSNTKGVEFYIEKVPADILLITTSVDTNKEQYLHIINILDGLGYNYDIIDDDNIENKDIALYKMVVVVGDAMELLNINSNEEQNIVDAINSGVDVLWIGNGIEGTNSVTLPNAFGINYIDQKSAASYNIAKMGWADIGGNQVATLVNGDEYLTRISLNSASAEGYFLKNDNPVFPSITYYRKNSTTGKTVYIGFDIFSYWKQYNNDVTWSRAELFVKYLRELGTEGIVSLHPFPNAKKAVFIVRLEDLTPSGIMMNQNDPVWVNRFNNTVNILNEKGIPLNLALISVYEDPYRGEVNYWNETGRNVPALRYVLEKTLSLGGSLIAHGYTHQNGEGSDDYSGGDYEMWDEDTNTWLTYEEQLEKTSLAMDLINKEFNVTAKTWETPHYKSNEDTYLAAKNSGFIYSCEGDNKIFPNPYGYENIINNNLLNIPETAFDLPQSVPQSFIDMHTQHTLPRLERIHGGYFIFYHNNFDSQYNALKQIAGNVSKMDYWFPNIDEYGDWWVNKTNISFEWTHNKSKSLMEVNLIGTLKDITLHFRLPDGKILKNVIVNGNLIPVKTEKINDILYVYAVFDLVNSGNVKLYYTDADTISLDLSLNQGWNLISMPLELDDWTLTETLKSIEGNYSKVVAYNSSDLGNEWKIYDPNDLPHSNLESIDEKMGIWIKMLVNDTLVVKGLEFDTINFTLKQGYNLISYSSLNENNVSYVFGEVISDVENILSYENGEWKSYSPLKGDELNSLKIIKPEQGYWVNVKSDTSWLFDSKFR